MLQKLKTKQGQSGFTIIEVMIVLAIAGLILLIVFLAVPALQRNAHNTSAKNDVSNILGGINEYVNNNNGNLPTTLANTGTNTVNISGGVGTNAATAKVGYYDASTVKVVTSDTFPTQGAGVNIRFGVACNDTGTATVTGSPRNYVALFTLEGGAKECTAS